MIKVGESYQLKNGSTVIVKKLIKDYESKREFALTIIDNEEYVYDLERLNINLDMKQVSKNKRSVDEKIGLYRSYFRGNNNVVATSFKTNEVKMVYFPWCHIRKRLPCPKVNKPKFKCSMCKVSSFQKFTDEIIFHHLRGYNNYNKEVMYGLYPIFDNDKTYLLVFDFDKKNWKNETITVVNIIKQLELDYLIEISQSGNGAHIWLFFENKILAKKARTLGNIILMQAMKDYPELSFESFDRMFPSQNSISNDGLGNLIALPLQGNRVVKGFNRFVNDDLTLINDVWKAIENTTKILETSVDKIVNKYSKDYQVDYFKAEHNLVKKHTLFEEEYIESEKSIEIYVGSEISINLNELTKEEIVKLKFLASFQNMAYYKARNQRRSTKGIPKVITLCNIDNSFIRLPRGLLNKVTTLFPNSKVIDKQVKGHEIEVEFLGDLYDNQKHALDSLSKYNEGLLCAGTGFGKTVVASKLIADKKVSTLILVNNKNLAHQWKSQLESFINLKNEPFLEYTPKGRLKKKDKIGLMYGGKISQSKNIDIALFQSLTTIDDLEVLLNDYGMVIVDEAHHVAAKTFEDVLSKIKSKYVYGLTATPKREDGLENIIYLRMGPIRHVVEKEVPNHIAQKLFLRFTSLGEHISNIQDNFIHDNNEMIVNSKDRNKLIINDIKEAINENRHIIVLSRYVEHIKVLKEFFDTEIGSAKTYILNSHMKTTELKLEMESLQKEGKPFVLFTTGSYAGEGFDLPALDTLMLVMPIKAKSSIQQYLGRLLRNLNDKEELRVYDYVDYAIPMFYKMYLKRLRTYKKLGYSFEESIDSELYKSSIVEGDYHSILNKDLIRANEFVMMIPFLSHNEIDKLIKIGLNSKAEKVISITQKSANIMKDRLSELEKCGFKVMINQQVNQNIVIIDKRLVWTIPISNNEENVSQMSLRIYSNEIADRLLRYVNTN
ncbi:DEAD/DEAH box helicase family protein [Staphylococcus sp. IVB6238]|uniref:TOTE conflict system archaeo-eukaryotic primase domain-containing protein n=1 Tax=Staphylococcus sp. IVB6238 TaxID=2989770 RepID=UPI0021D13AE0|nr:DEAD/DEAH box helicase family protein [Staphylococcus sp. IVB6238]UXR73552.1 DEAD/DEAH box helicase family protein [Staphylococcus sp. IVB6238]